MPYITIRPRRGTASEWYQENPVLERGEFVVEVPDSGVGTGASRFKIGDGETTYDMLPYALDPSHEPKSIDGRGVEIFNIVLWKGQTEEEWSAEDPVLADRELGYDSTGNFFKVGDGTHKWSELSQLKCIDLIDNALDFGDEEGDIAAAEAIVASNAQYGAKCLPRDWDDPIKDPDLRLAEEGTGGIDTVEETEDNSENNSDDSTAGIDDLLGE